MLRSLLALALFVSLTVAWADAEKSKTPPDKKAEAVKLTADEKALLDVLNQARSKEKLSKLVVNPLLCKVARQHTANMARQEKIDQTLDERSLSQRVTDAGYAASVVGENCIASADGPADEQPPPPADIHAAWMKSKEHRDNLLARDYAEVGVNIGRSKKGAYFYSVVFAAPRKPAAVLEGDKEKALLIRHEKELIRLLNQTRGKANLSKLVVNPLLSKVARRHTENMARQEKMDHELDGKKVKDRVTAAGYDYRIVGENLARSFSNDKNAPASAPEEIHKGWMDSKDHRDHILEPKFTEVGVSIGRSKKGTFFYTMVFAAPDR